MLTQTTGILVFGGLLVIIAIVAIIIFAVLSTRRTNQRNQSSTVAGEGNIRRDPTISKKANDVEDTEGNFSRSVGEKQDTKSNTKTK